MLFAFRTVFQAERGWKALKIPAEFTFWTLREEWFNEVAFYFGIFDISQCFAVLVFWWLSSCSCRSMQPNESETSARILFVIFIFYSFCLFSVFLFVSKNNFDIFPLSSLGNWRHKIVTELDERRHYDQSVFVKNVPKKWRKMHGGNNIIMVQ